MSEATDTGSMSAVEHYREAERLIVQVADRYVGIPEAMYLIAAAQVHATLALFRGADA